MVKKSWGRLGAAVGVVALLTGGLVGVAAPAQAEHPQPMIEDVSSYAYCNTSLKEYTVEEVSPFCDKVGVTYVGSTPNGPDHNQFWGECPSGQVPKKPGVFVFGDDLGCKKGSNPPLTAEQCEADGKVLNDDEDACRDKEASDCVYGELFDEDTKTCESDDRPVIGGPSVGGEGIDGKKYESVYPYVEGEDPPSDQHVRFTSSDGQEFWGIEVTNEPVQKAPPPPPCWSAEALNNCPVGGALRFAAPKYAMVGVPVTMYAYASWRPDANAPSQPTNGSAVIRVDGEDYSGVEFVDGIAQWRFIPETEGMKEFTASGVVFSEISGANAYIDTVPARTYVLEYDPAAYAAALKSKRVEVGDTYVITDPNQARSYLEDRYEWSVSEKSDDVCAVYETKKGAVKAKFNGEGKCTVIWMDKESEEEGKYTFIAKK